jgi:hypothetical protein
MNLEYRQEEKVRRAFGALTDSAPLGVEFEELPDSRPAPFIPRVAASKRRDHGGLTALVAATALLAILGGTALLLGGNATESSEAATPASVSFASASVNPFIGSWETFDDLPDDKSRIRLQIGNDGTLVLRDEAASGCRNNGFGFVPATLTAQGEFDSSSDPSVVEASGDLYCYPRDGRGRTLLVSDVFLRFEYDADKDVLIGTHGQETCFSRVGSGSPSDCS